MVDNMVPAHFDFWLWDFQGLCMMMTSDSAVSPGGSPIFKMCPASPASQNLFQTLPMLSNPHR